MLIPSARVLFGDLLEQVRDEADTDISISRDTFRRLLLLYVSCWRFDEKWYLETYSDIQDAIRKGVFPSPFAHFVDVGYFEGRLPCEPVVDEKWYLARYPDIAKAVIDGQVASAKEHFIQFGYAEGRVSCDPHINPNWYIPRFFPGCGPDKASVERLTAHFVDYGYRHFAVPAPPR